jgi:hypothetical protein
MSYSDYSLLKDGPTAGAELSTAANWDPDPSHTESQPGDGLIDKNLIVEGEYPPISKVVPLFGPANNLLNIIVGMI